MNRPRTWSPWLVMLVAVLLVSGAESTAQEADSPEAMGLAQEGLVLRAQPVPQGLVSDEAEALFRDAVFPHGVLQPALFFGPEGQTLNAVGVDLSRASRGDRSLAPLRYESWEPLTGRLLDTREVLPRAESCGAPREVSSRGQLLCRGEGRFQLLSVTSPESAIGLEGVPEFMGRAVFSADGRALAAYVSTGELLVWNTATGGLQHRVSLPQGERQPPDSLHLSPDGARLFFSQSRGSELSVTFVQLASGERRRDPLPGAAAAVGFGPDGLPLVICRMGSRLQAWRPQGAEGGWFQDLAIVVSPETGLLLSPDTRLLLLKSAGTLRAVDVELGSELWSIPSSAQTMRFSQEGRLLAVAGPSQLQLVDVASGRVRSVWSLELPNALGLSADGSILATASRVTGPAGKESYLIQGWELGSGSLQYSFALETAIGERPLQLRVSRDGTTLLAADEWGSIGWSTQDVRPRMVPTRGRSSAVGRNGGFAVALDGELRVQGPGGSSSVRVPAMPRVVAMAFSWDESRLYTLDSEQRLSGWDLETGRGTSSVQLRQVRGATWMDASPSGHLLVQGAARGEERETWLIDPKQGRVVALPVMRGAESCQAFTPDGRFLLLGSSPARLLELQTGRETPLSSGVGKELISCAFSPDGKTLALGSVEEGVRVVSWPELKPVASVRVGEKWLLRRGAHVVRANEGTVLYRRGADGRLLPVPPAEDPRGAPQLEATLRLEKEPGEGRETGLLQVHVRNTGAGDAHWVEVAAEPQGQLPGVTLWPPPPLARLAPGESKVIEVGISSVNPAGPRTRTGTPLLVLRHVQGMVPLELTKWSFRAPQVELENVSTQGDSDNAVVQVSLRNTGTQASGPLRLSARFLRGDTQVGEKIDLGVPIPSLNPLEEGGNEASTVTTLAIPTPQALRKSRESFQVELLVRGELWPTHQWVLRTAPQRVGSGSWVGFSLSVAALLLLGVVITFVGGPRLLRRVTLQNLPWLDRLLRRIGVLDVVLAQARLQRSHWERTVRAAKGGEAAARAFEDAVGARLRESLPGLERAWVLQLSWLQLSFKNAKALLVCEENDLESDWVSRITQHISQPDRRKGYVIILDFTTNQRVARLVSNAMAIELIVLTTAELRDVLLDGDPNTQLEQIIALKHLAFSRDLYQTSGGLTEDRLFFGREPELKKVCNGKPRNFVVIAARQSGKSSFLKAVERRMLQRKDMEVLYVGAAYKSLAETIAREMNRPVPEDALGFRALVQGTRERPRLWLVDEADEFVNEELKRGFQQTMVMRELAEAGLAYFILAGSWHLYRAVYFDLFNPLRNFAERIDLGPLDEDSARQLATQPLKLVKVRFDHPDTVKYLLEQTGRRANLIAISCNEMYKRLGPQERVLTRAHLDAVFEQNQQLRDALNFYRFSSPLERAVLRAAILEGERPTRAGIRKRLEAAGAKPKSAELDGCLQNLEIAYLLIPVGNEYYRCPVPLLRRMFERDSERELRLRDDIEEALEDQAAVLKSLA